MGKNNKIHKIFVNIAIVWCMLALSIKSQAQEVGGISTTHRNITFDLHGEGYPPLTLEIMDSPYSSNQRNKARQVILRRMTINHHDGEPVYNTQCNQAVDGCEARISSLVQLIFESSRRHSLDPWLLISVGIITTNFNPFEHAGHGYGGLLGLNAFQYRNITFVTNVQYRRNCRESNDACQGEIIEAAAIRLSSSIGLCDRHANYSLRHYGTDNCYRNPQFSRRVLRVRRELLRQAEEIENLSWCNPPRPICEPGSVVEDPLVGIMLDVDFEM